MTPIVNSSRLQTTPTMSPNDTNRSAVLSTCCGQSAVKIKVHPVWKSKFIQCIAVELHSSTFNNLHRTLLTYQPWKSKFIQRIAVELHSSTFDNLHRTLLTYVRSLSQANVICRLTPASHAASARRVTNLRSNHMRRDKCDKSQDKIIKPCGKPPHLPMHKWIIYLSVYTLMIYLCMAKSSQPLI